MAPTKVKTGSSKGANKRHNKKDPASRSKKNNTNSVHKERPKEHGKTSHQKNRKAPKYSEAELNIPQLNMITPAGVEKPKGKKKGKVFVDDQESMATIFALVNADKDGEIESKMMKERQMEEIREARRKEMEARAEQRKSKLEDTKDAVRRKTKRSSHNIDPVNISAHKRASTKDKHVSFA